MSDVSGVRGRPVQRRLDPALEHLSRLVSECVVALLFVDADVLTGGTSGGELLDDVDDVKLGAVGDGDPVCVVKRAIAVLGDVVAHRM